MHLGCAAATRLLEAGQLRPRLDPSRVTLASLSEANAAIEDQSAHGKIVVDIAE
jgi:NADPH:quinone reductase